jgi:hypothetical protein
MVRERGEGLRAGEATAMSDSARRPQFGRAGAAPAVTHSALDKGALFLVTYADETYRFWPGTRMRFGRGDDVCQIPIWEEINRRSLSKVAGELWCSDGQMWARNVSTVHELVVTGPRGAQTLPAKLRADPGHACSVPIPIGTVTAPSTGTWSLEVRTVTAEHDLGQTLHVENIPERHRDAAEALCAPLLAGGSAVATYAEIATQLGSSERMARRRIDELCEHYENQLAALPGGRLPGETLAHAVARTLVARNKFAIPRLTSSAAHPGAVEHG